MYRVIASFVLTPLLYVLFLMLFAEEPSGNFLPGLVIVYSFMTVFGVPAILVSMRFKWFSWWHYALGGVAVGALCIATLMLMLQPGDDTRYVVALDVEDAMLRILLSAIMMALVFWLLAVYRNSTLVK